jgi:transcription-repair coupling factor (superfamily II helicase)
VRIESLSRFRSAKDVSSVIERTSSGRVDILIGTHKLLGREVRFRDLGLVIIDEEHRFGVRPKAQLKALRAEVDVLTLTATPIPRTLNLAMHDLRDLSIIATPPAKRLSIKTFVRQAGTGLVKEAILRELLRGGQVFYVHNEVRTIERTAREIEEMVPEARVAVGHGQLRERELEQVMSDFYHRRANVLVCTTIIETGIDIPNANTIIIDRADRFGLADLYQLRGRVGRGATHAYAILLIPRDLTIGGDASKRINAIKQYTALGSGFKIAMRDLEIRGAGNLLGTKQSGHISSVGFDLYCQLLRQSIERLRGNKNAICINVTLRADFLNFTETVGSDRRADRTQPKHTTPAITDHRSPLTANLNCYIPAHYMTEPTMRIRAYKQLAEAATEKTIHQLGANWQDQYGKLPTPAKNLLQTNLLKIAAAQANITSIEIKSQRLMLTRNNQYIMLSQKNSPA